MFFTADFGGSVITISNFSAVGGGELEWLNKFGRYVKIRKKQNGPMGWGRL